MAAFNAEEVLEVRHWTDTLFSFATTRDPGFRFISGQFTMIGLEVSGRPLMRAYSMASASHEDRLEFFSIKVADGPLTSQLQKIQAGDKILVSRRRPARWCRTTSCPASGCCCCRPGQDWRRSPA